MKLSFAYLTLYTGDYLRDTRHLTPLKHGVYLLLLMHCWDSRGPAPLDEQECAGIANCRSADEIEALRYVLAKYFVRMDDGHYNIRMSREIDKAKAISGARQQAAFTRHRGRDASQHANAMQVHSKSNALDTNTTTTTTITPNTTTSTTSSRPSVSQKSKSKAQAPFVLPPEIPEMQWQAWLESRAKARKSPTDFAKKLAVAKLKDLEEQGHSPAAVLAQSAFNGWSGLFPVKAK